jgi:hypothetical protein
MKPISLVSFATILAALGFSSESFAQTYFNCDNGTECVESQQLGAGEAGLFQAGSYVAIEGVNDSSEWEAISGYNYSSGAGVAGQSTGGDGVQGSTTSGTGGYFISGSGAGVIGTTSSTSGESGLAGFNSGTGNGVYGKISGSTGTSSALSADNQATGGTSNGLYVNSAASGGTASYGIFVDDTSDRATTHYAAYFKGNVEITGTLNGMTPSSDIRLKKNVQPLAASALDKLLQLHGVTYEWKDPQEYGAGTQTGFVAQDVERIFPTWVKENDEGIKQITSMRGFEAMLVESVRTLKGENDQLKSRLDRLEDGTNPSQAGFTFGNGGWGFAGLAFGTLLVSKRKKAAPSSP